MRLSVLTSLLFIMLLGSCRQAERVRLDNDLIRITWEQTGEGWKIIDVKLKASGKWVSWGKPDGLHTLLYSADQPSTEPVEIRDKDGQVIDFPDPGFKYIVKTFERAITPVPMNTAGEAIHFYPDTCRWEGQSLVFEKELSVGRVRTTWSIDQTFGNDICVEQELIVTEPGYYSQSSVTLATIGNDDLQWGVVPGYYQGKDINPELIHSYGYGQGLPPLPVLCRESTITSPTSILTDKYTHSLAFVIEPGQESPRVADGMSRHDQLWRISVSHMNRDGQLSPTGYHPVLGEDGSLAKAGDVLTFSFRYSLHEADWYDTYKHVVNDICGFDQSLRFKRTEQSLTDRVLSMHTYLTDNKTSHWNIETYQGRQIGAQSYMGGVAGADNDAMKNSDIGAVWILAELMQDKVLRETRLPYIRNFKIAQQAISGFFSGAAAGQYYLAQKQTFVEEWGNHYEPIGLTYYTLCDIGNILLFEPEDDELREKLIAGAERLLAWQLEDGSWPVAFDRDTHQPIFTDLQDYRPTFYGMYIAHRITGEEKYLEAAIKGADWYVEQAVANGYFIGVCGDVRFVNDFATAQSVQALLDMFELTGKTAYRQAAVETAKIYTTSVYTYPVVDDSPVTLKDKTLQNWQLAQSGLGFEHGGIMGSAVLSGPILLAGHTGLFIRMAYLTGDPLFANMARAGALGRDAFINKDSHVASYYWTRFDEGPGQFPHHAWWQVGWILDYLVAEVSFRSDNDIQFGRGFVTPKVGPHQTCGFDTGTINGTPVRLRLFKDIVRIDNPNIDYLMAESVDGKAKYILLLNQQQQTNVINVTIDGKKWGISSPEMTDLYRNSPADGKAVELSPFGLTVLKLTDKNK